MKLKTRVMTLRKALIALVTCLLLSATLTAGATAPSQPAAPKETNACWSDDAGNTACAPNQTALRQLILQKFDKILVADQAELESVRKTKTYESLAVPDSAQATYALGTLHTDSNFSGSSWTPSTYNSMACYGQYYYYEYGSVPHNDQYSSFTGQSGCQIRLYDDINWGGGYYGYYDCRSNLANVGYNDRASSVRFFLTTTYSCF